MKLHLNNNQSFLKSFQVFIIYLKNLLSQKKSCGHNKVFFEGHHKHLFIIKHDNLYFNFIKGKVINLV